MYRFALEYLKAWKSKPNRKPLLIRGARQVGKTYLWLYGTFLGFTVY
jgi:predicted AAA+ superfamily ATPase